MNTYRALRKRGAPARPYAWAIFGFAGLLLSAGAIATTGALLQGHYLSALLIAAATVAAADSASAVSITTIQAIRQGWKASYAIDRKLDILTEAVFYVFPHGMLTFVSLIFATGASKALADPERAISTAGVLVVALAAITIIVAAGFLQNRLGPLRFQPFRRPAKPEPITRWRRLRRMIRYADIALTFCATGFVILAVVYWIQDGTEKALSPALAAFGLFVVGNLLSQWGQSMVENETALPEDDSSNRPNPQAPAEQGTPV